MPSNWPISGIIRSPFAELKLGQTLLTLPIGLPNSAYRSEDTPTSWLIQRLEDCSGPLPRWADQLRHLIETLDLLYDAFGQRRFGKEWADTLSRMQRWLSREERRAA